MSSGTLYVIAAPSGAGKTTLVRALVESMENIRVSISHTTRPRRQCEVDGVNYHFVNESAFQQLIEKNMMLEHANVYGHHCGTSRQWVAQE